MQATSMKSTSNGGPEWAQVVARLVVQTETDRVVESRTRQEMDRRDEHAALTSGKTNLTMYLLFVKDRWGHQQARLPKHSTATTSLS